MRQLLLILCLFLPVSTAAQGFAGLGAPTADGFATPAPNNPPRFPQDHAAHPEYRIEWWYLTANMTGPDGTPYGAQWTLFRSALEPREAEGWDSRQIWMGHAALTTADAHFVSEKFARGGIGQAGVTPEPFAAWIDDWQAAGPTLNDIHVTAHGEGFSYALSLRAEAPFVLQGVAGYSVKSQAGQASYYYSQPFYELTGHIQIGDRSIPVTGTAWLDREWSSQPLAETQTGWDWFSINLDDGRKLMAFRLRDAVVGDYHSGTVIQPDGATTPLAPDALEVVPLDDADPVPTHWRVTVPDHGINVEATALNPDAFMTTTFPYWEGPVVLSGSHGGVGYLEMTGYE